MNEDALRFFLPDPASQLTRPIGHYSIDQWLEFCATATQFAAAKVTAASAKPIINEVELAFAIECPECYDAASGFQMTKK